ncbi:MAG: hypothetical protein ACFE0Q_13700 [Anaerolineae bacterium]
MVEKRKNSEQQSRFSFSMAVLLVVAGLFAGFQLAHSVQNTANQDEFAKPPQVDLTLDAEIDLSGEWVGTTTEDYGNESRYDYRLVLTQNGDMVTGMSYLDMASDPEIYSESEIAGIVSGQTFVFTEVNTLVLDNISMDNWCLADTTVTYQVLNGQETLIGSWELAHHERAECGDISGRVILTRQAAE